MLPLGKVPPKILKQTIFEHLGATRNDVVVGPSEGEDAAILRLGDQLLAIHCDPISGAFSRIGWIAMHIATNDIATQGVKPRWALSCIMLPQGSSEKILATISKQMSEAAERLGVTIVGGHSETTLGLDHPLVIITALGAIENERYVTTSGARPRSKIILTKRVGIEGTAILASDRGKILKSRFGDDFVRKCVDYFNDLSVLKEATIAFQFGGVQGMHDPTEGGISNGLHELANASKTGFRVYEKEIQISYETHEICRFFGIDPLNLISSGSLLIVAEHDFAEGIICRLRENGISAFIIGEVLSNDECRVIVRKNGAVEPLIRPECDGLWAALDVKI
ncbi:MAG: AIR synthase family protein [Candidatus Bathyarchaeota archaeon]|nr:MAG: AIR synthase family protein [Candidatus Bathyarchaeota archaeon]